MDTVTKTIITLTPYLKNFSRNVINPNIEEIKCFQFIGFDIMLDK